MNYPYTETGLKKGTADRLYQAVASNMAPLVNKLMRGRRDATVVTLSDSTGFNTNRYLYQLCDLIRTYYPEYTVIYYQWSSTDYDAGTTIQTGTGSKTLRWYNGAVSGSTTFRMMGLNWANAIRTKSPDLVILNYGHNQAAYAASDDSAITPTFERGTEGSMRSLIEAIRRDAPDAGIIANIQNPGSANAGQFFRADVYRSLYMRLGVAYVDTLPLFLNADGTVNTGLLADTVHPTTAGSALQAGKWAPFFAKRQQYESSTLQRPASTYVGRFLYRDPYLLNGIPDATTTNLTLSRDTTYTEGSSGFSIKLTPTATTQGSFYVNSVTPVAQLFGQWVTLTVRMYCPAAITGASAGRIGISDGITSAVSEVPGDEAQDGWFTHTISFKVAASGASYLRAYVYGGNTTNGTAMYIQELHFVQGRDPVLALPRPDLTQTPSQLVPFAATPAYDLNGTSGYFTVPNNAAFNFGTSNFSIGAVIVPKTFAPSAEQPIINCFSGNNGWKLTMSTGGLLTLYIGNGSSFTSYAATASLSTVASATAYVPIVVSLNRSGNVTFYANGVQVGNPVSISGQSGTTVTTAGALQVGYDGTTYASFGVATVALYNGVVDGSYMGRAGIPLFAKWGGTVAYQSNFSAGFDSWTSSNVTRTGNVDGVSDGSTSKNDTLKIEPSTTSSVAHVSGRNSIFTPLQTYRITFTYYIPSANTNVKGLRFYNQSGAALQSLIPDQTVTGAWTTVSYDVQIPSGMTGMQFRSINNAASETFAAVTGGTDDIYYLADFSATAVGASVAYEAFPTTVGGSVWRQSNPGYVNIDLSVVNGATALIRPFMGDQVIGQLIGANFNVTTDQAITINNPGSRKFVVTRIMVTNASTSLTTAAGGFYTAASKTNAIVAAGQVYTALTASTKYLNCTLATLATTDVFTVSTLYLALTTAQGSACTADVFVFGYFIG